jgi:hypothetical protein
MGLPPYYAASGDNVIVAVLRLRVSPLVIGLLTVSAIDTLYVPAVLAVQNEMWVMVSAVPAQFVQDAAEDKAFDPAEAAE